MLESDAPRYKLSTERKSFLAAVPLVGLSPPFYKHVLAVCPPLALLPAETQLLPLHDPIICISRGDVKIEIVSPQRLYQGKVMCPADVSSAPWRSSFTSRCRREPLSSVR